jgi:hypothetical protein
MRWRWTSLPMNRPLTWPSATLSPSDGEREGVRGICLGSGSRGASRLGSEATHELRRSGVSAERRKPLSMNRPLTRPSATLSPSDGEREGVRGTRARVGAARCWPGALTTVLLFALVVLTGCESSGGGGNVSGSAYYGVGFYDPWYYGGYYDDPDIIVTPPPSSPGGAHPSHPIAKPPSTSGPRPTPMPSIPSRPMPRAR